MATVTHHNELLPILSSGDIVSNELYYHKNTKNCYVEFNNSYARAMNQSSESEIGTGEWIKALSLNKILS